jgi:hypothetical protein
MALLLILPAPALAQAATQTAGPPSPDELDRKVAERLAQTSAVYGVPDPRLRCRPQPGSDEIVVCVDRGEDQQVDRTPPDPNSLEGRRALNNGVPRAPQFDKGYCKECPHFGSVPAPVYYIDMKAIPEPPEGSDADKIAKGEMPPP